MTEKKKIKVNIPIVMAGVLFYFVLLTTCMMGGLYARYTSSRDASDSARTAAFHVTMENSFYSKNLVIDLEPGVTKETIKVKNDSEVKVAVTVTVENKTKNLPLEFLMYQGDTAIGESVGDSYVYERIMDTKGEQTFTLQILWPQEGALEDMGKVDLINVSVRVVQID